MSKYHEQNISILCESCKKTYDCSILIEDEHICDDIKNILTRIKFNCSQCSVLVASNNDSRQTHIDKLHLESLKILMSEMVDQRMDAKIEWTHAQNIRALMSTFDLHCDELDSQLNNPNKAVMSNNAMWVVLPYHVCELIRDTLTKEMNIPQNQL